MSFTKYLFSAPTAGEIDISLSLRITIRGTFLLTQALFIASNAMPALIAPSPITATTLRFSFLVFAAIAIPKAAEMLVEE